ncbi:MAG: tetratricopeptide repeat protein [Gallionella sp.]
MKNRYAWFFVSVWLLLLAGCAGVTSPTPSETRQPGEAAIIEAVPKSAMSDNRAVIALLDRAQTDNESGQREAAGASLERALRIEPRNPWLWLELAQVRLVQGQYAQAITLARKSNSFAGRQLRVQAGNWQVIGQARVALGDSAGGEQAFKLAAELAQQAKVEAGHGSIFNFQ